MEFGIFNAGTHSIEPEANYASPRALRSAIICSACCR
jgi:hypothetical protein